MIRVLLAEDMIMLRRALASLLELESDIEVVAETGNGDEVLPLARLHRPDVAVLDIDMPGIDGIEAAALLHSELPECRTTILTTLGRPGNLRRALAAHASGFLLKDTEPARLAAAIREVVAGGRVVDPELALSALQTGESPLSARETEVLRLAAAGEEVPEIARALFLSAGTVRNYLTAAVTRLDARNRMDAVRIARNAGWL
ncbi:MULTISPECIES: response regulator transcription factor [unclassified Streptomyces]|uniref:Response regulator transcription factor n=2 Tax=Streptomyces TaxID=1883 RepID=A0ABU2RER2_9ACTN|nr:MULTISPECIES: response regulator transcription factor [unclassified Streptomyces]MYR70124.1 response regulator [Streptomyces sp. SID4939]MYS03861.1 response regulator [Streptomyces sp. SID4940]MYT64507.1 response regulator [Streptomyces sp. SID8357]MYT87320.1 response regulator [Streptomyces sp. SID8360]MYU34771.1 response regulator [Streptomyces sp. SID8358]MYW37117.1 response regulator [Streptomyces sp. SID1]MYX73183.1 response regulator [Streptomyces sp. SID3915]HBF82407.1 DNA-binding